MDEVTSYQQLYRNVSYSQPYTGLPLYNMYSSLTMVYSLTSYQQSFQTTHPGRPTVTQFYLSGPHHSLRIILNQTFQNLVFLWTLSQNTSTLVYQLSYRTLVFLVINLYQVAHFDTTSLTAVQMFTDYTVTQHHMDYWSRILCSYTSLQATIVIAECEHQVRPTT